jgi:dTDP-4-dehydrorhamnose reductase
VLVELSQTSATGIFHATNSGRCSWYQFARRIAISTGHDPDLVRPASTESLARPAPRPPWSVLDCTATWARGIEPLRPWQEALEDYLERAGLKTAGSA